MVTATVHAFMRKSSDGPDPGQPGRTRQHPLGVVRAQPHPLPLGRRQLPWLVEDRDGHAVQPDVVHVPGPPGSHDIGGRESHGSGRFGGQLGHAQRVPGAERAAQIGEIPECAHRRVQLRPRQPALQVRFGGDKAVHI